MHLFKRKSKGYKLIAKSKFFDKRWYLKTYPDVAAAGMDPVEHYLEHGWREGRKPSSRFDVAKYVRTNHSAQTMNPVLHYELFNQHKKRSLANSDAYKKIKRSKYFDKKWYLKTYPDVARGGVDPVEHYLLHGWREGRKPCAVFSSEGYLLRYPDVKENPLVHYESVGKKEKREIGVYVNNDAIQNYFAERSKLKKVNKVVYSCVSGSYDDIILDCHLDPSYDYVLFTDNADLLKQKNFYFWQVRPMQFAELDSVRNARWHKLHPDILLPEYEYSVWIDSNVQIKGPKIYDLLQKHINKKVLMATALHPSRDCLYEEARACILDHKDNPEIILKQISLIRKDGFPEHWGLAETNIFLRRHNDPAVKHLMEQWWWWINHYSRRDQLSFTYLLWKTGTQCYGLSETPLRFLPEFKLKQHRYKPLCEKTQTYQSENDGSKKLLVHLHLYYHDQLDFFISKLKNITCDYDLFVTYVEKNPESETKLKKFKPSVHLIQVQNKGYDLAPFIAVLNKVNLDNYNYIIKVHTKNSRNTYWSYKGINYIRFQWRNALVNALIGSKKIFKDNLKMLKRVDVGMIGNTDLLAHGGAKANEEYRQKLLKKLNYNPKYDMYIAGTMFVCKAFLMRDIQNLHLTMRNFEYSGGTGEVGTLAHALESILGHTAQNCGTNIVGREVWAWNKVQSKIRQRIIARQKRKKLTDYQYIKKSKLFDKRWYLKTYPDVAKAKLDPVEHYLKFGWQEGRNPSAKFDAGYYLKRYPDISAAHICPLLHYEKHGKYEGRMCVAGQQIPTNPFLYPMYLQKELRRVQKQPVIKNNLPIIVSLTTYPKRIYAVIKTIESILCQTKRPDKIVLYLTYEEFPNKSKGLPKELLRLKKYGVEIDWCHNLRSYNKLLPALKKYPNAIHITVDDDIIYKPTMIEKLYNSYLKYPHDIQCHRVTKLYYDNGYRTQVGGRDYHDNGSYLNKLTGVGGVLYPVDCFYKDVFDEALIKELAPTNDDQWFWFQSVLNGVKTRVVDQFEPDLEYVENSQETGLYLENDMGQNLFWKDFGRLMEYYPQMNTIFMRELRMRKILKMLNVIKSYIMLPYNLLWYTVYKHKKLAQPIKDNEYYSHLSPSEYPSELKEWYKKMTGYGLDLDNPKTFNEKIQWLKLYDSTPEKTRLADKYLVREWIKKKIGEQYLIPLLGVYDSFEEIDFDKLPNQFVIKCNHGSGYNIIVKDKSKLDLQDAKKKLDKWMNSNFAFEMGLELHYRDMKPKIIIEQYMDDGAADLMDYKYTCFDGKPYFIWIDRDRHSVHKRNLYDLNWHQMDCKINSKYDCFEGAIKPKKLKEMNKLAAVLSHGFAYARVDFYIIKDKIYFGEITFTSGSGIEDVKPYAFEFDLSQKLKLPDKMYDLETNMYKKR